MLWQLPGISLAAQAFLLSAGLDSKAEPSSQVVVGLLGIAAVLGTGLVILYQTVRATIFGDWVDQTVPQPLGPEELATERLEYSRRKIWLVRCMFKAFYTVCAGALLALLAADVYVLGQGAGWF
ncbi:MAG TPA: hypothetical protein VJT75_10450 [Thermoleophilaceae bacterium]|nr:hypothetical protein [Thermoleophilaceae bacterium]